MFAFFSYTELFHSISSLLGKCLKTILNFAFLLLLETTALTFSSKNSTFAIIVYNRIKVRDLFLTTLFITITKDYTKSIIIIIRLYTDELDKYLEGQHLLLLFSLFIFLVFSL